MPTRETFGQKTKVMGASITKLLLPPNFLQNSCSPWGISIPQNVNRTSTHGKSTFRFIYDLRKKTLSLLLPINFDWITSLWQRKRLELCPRVRLETLPPAIHTNKWQFNKKGEVPLHG